MLREGYREFLTAVSQSELALQFRAATARHVGLHLVALSVGDWQAAQARLASEGFQPNDPVHLARPVEDEVGKLREARFTVLRVPPEAMPEGRIQLLRSEEHTSELQSLMRISYAVFCLKKNTHNHKVSDDATS